MPAAQVRPRIQTQPRAPIRRALLTRRAALIPRGMQIRSVVVMMMMQTRGVVRSRWVAQTRCALGHWPVGRKVAVVRADHRAGGTGAATRSAQAVRKWAEARAKTAGRRPVETLEKLVGQMEIAERRLVETLEKPVGQMEIAERRLVETLEKPVGQMEIAGRRLVETLEKPVG